MMSHVVLTCIAILLTVGGNAITIIGLNFWLATFPAQVNGQFAAAFTSACLYFICFFLVLTFYTYKFGWRRVFDRFYKAALSSTSEYSPLRGIGISSTFRWSGTVGILAMMGFSDVGSNILSFYATPHTPEILQALLQSTICLWTLVLSFYFVKGDRSKKYCVPSLVCSIVSITCGISLSIIHFGAKKKSGGNPSLQMGWWVVYASSALVYAAWCVLQRIFLDQISVTEEMITKNHVQFHEEEKVHWTDDVSAKLIMLTGDTFFQLVFTVLLVPVDGIPSFGGSATFEDSWQRFAAGVRYVFHNRDCALYGLLYSGGYLVSYLGSAYLNHYSPTLNSMMIQLSAPVTAVILIIIPTWNIVRAVTKEYWYQQSAAILLLVLGAISYRSWEESQRQVLESPSS